MVRLASLREQQHDEAVAHLRAARMSLDATDREVEHHEAASRQALLQQNAALVQADQREWLLSCAAWEVESLHVRHLRAESCAAQSAVTAAEESERRARRELRQTERLLESIGDVQKAAAFRRDQKTMDDAAQLLRIRSSKQGRMLGMFS